MKFHSASRMYFEDEQIEYEADNEDSDNEDLADEKENFFEYALCQTSLVYNCGDCNKDFRYKHELKMHTRKHTRTLILQFSMPSSNRNLFSRVLKKKLQKEPLNSSLESDGILPPTGRYKSFLLAKAKKKHNKAENGIRNFKKAKDVKEKIQTDENSDKEYNENVLKISYDVISKAETQEQKKCQVSTEKNESTLLQMHMRYKCRICQRRFLTRGELIKHGKIHDHLRNKKCRICGKPFIKDDCLKNHENRHKKLGFYYRSVHLKKLKSEEKVENDSTLEPPSLKNADIFNSTGHGNKHNEDEAKEGREVHSDINNIGTDLPTQITKNKNHGKEIGESVQMRISKMPYNCRVCSQSFAFRGDLVKHGKVHDHLKINECHICGKTFIMKDSLKCHINRHFFLKDIQSKPRKFKESCNDGPTTIQKKSRKTKVNAQKCEICGKLISTRCNLRKHMSRMHSDDFPFDCDYCRGRFKSENDLEIHLSVHRKRRPYKCVDCGKLFATNPELHVHYRQHDGYRPYSCQICYKGFLTNMDLLKHIRLHNGLKPFKCVACDKAFRTNTGLDAHTQECLGFLM